MDEKTPVPAEARLHATVGLERYGIGWRGPNMPIALPMPDGHWTPWHLAQQEIERLRTLLSETRNYVMAYSPSGAPFDFPRDLIQRIDQEIGR